MGSTHLGGRNAAALPLSTCTSASHKSQNIQVPTANKANPTSASTPARAPSLANNTNADQNHNRNRNIHHHNSGKRTTAPIGTAPVRPTTGERGPTSIVHAGRSSAKSHPGITTISKTRINNNNNHTYNNGGSHSDHLHSHSGQSGHSGHTSSSHSGYSSSRSGRNISNQPNASATGATTGTTTTTTAATAPPAPSAPYLYPRLAPSTGNPRPILTPPIPPIPPTPSTPILPVPPIAPPPITVTIASTTTSTSASTIAATPATARKARPLSLSARKLTAPLRDQNGAPIHTPTLKESRKMGYDNSPNPSTTATASSRPQMPSLSTGAARGINRAPLTPKIAARPSQPATPSHVGGNASATTPLPKRTQRRPTSTIAPSNVTTTASNRASLDGSDAITAAFLSANITPRSGSRQSRVNSANTTPNGTPSQDRSDPWESGSSLACPSPSSRGDTTRRPVVTFSAVIPDRNILSGQNTTNPRDSKFFHASDVKPSRPTSAHKMASPRNSAFFYANGNGNGSNNALGITSKSASPATLSPPLSPGLSQTQDSILSKFMYANGTPELQPPPPSIASRDPGHSGPVSSKGPAARSTPASQRPASPNKPPLHSSSSSHRNSLGSQSSASATSGSRAPVVSPPLLKSNSVRRRPGTSTPRSSGHSRSGSLAKVEGVAEPWKPVASPTTGLFPPANLSPTVAPPLTLASIIQAAEEFAEQEQEQEQDKEGDHSADDEHTVQSPTKSTGSSADPVNELVANARRERKVQDLQIRNASLEAINRTIERQLRKQAAELRRYRRLSRAGHLAVATTAMPDHIPPETISEVETESLALPDQDEEDISAENQENESFSDSESVSSDLSASALAEKDAKHRPRDEERLQLDLSKHKQMLVDSQKINQSIRKCLAWSEELIKDGKKALEYKVKLSDVKIGGRVLRPMDEEEDVPKMLPLDTASTLDSQADDDASEISTSWGAGSQDRDSGIELSKDSVGEEGELQAR